MGVKYVSDSGVVWSDCSTESILIIINVCEPLQRTMLSKSKETSIVFYDCSTEAIFDY